MDSFQAKKGISFLDVELLVAIGEIPDCTIIGTSEGRWVVQINNNFVIETSRWKVKYFSRILTALEALHAAGVEIISVKMQDWESGKSKKKKKNQ